MGTVHCKCRWALLAVGILANCLLTGTGFVQATAGSGHGDEAKTRDLRDKGLILVKIWCLVILFSVTFAGGISPYFWRWNQSFLALGTQFAAGVFLGTALMHFLSDSNQAFQDLGLKEYPMAFMLCSLGYLLTMLAECVLLWVNQRTSVGNECGEGKEEAEEGGGGGGGGGGRRRQRRRARAGESALLILALCFHSVFEGMALGVAETKGGAWRILWTVCLHKVFAATAMAIALLKMMPNRPFLSCAAYASAFGLSSPVGVSIGIIVDSTTEGPVAQWLFAITMGLATGIFIYVALNHMLRDGAHAQPPRSNSNRAREEDDDDDDDSHGPSLYNFVGFLLGVGVIAVAMIWDD